ncbi:branched-chain amino acid transport system substrate-binding protein [Nonomuraea thailandensis]|uniref:Branched-chain amino acid transport system substrate-binding protein n=1 Tax=Nonomuraea thailandensis TaxID=1188745 RepID=A0A9X2G9J7_9ACTN|nr:ABC transporter substrate-binding protein [Nonomuraea thailandensis]MCP2353570.1 branched-chain amino acid transport system substrate-binding protein [Nonomuraea thailandensis]
MKMTWIAAFVCVVPLAAGCGGSAPSGAVSASGGHAEGGSIKIGSLHPLSGAAAADGQQMENGAKLAVEAVNSAGGIKSLGGAKLELLSADTQGKPEVGQSEAQRVVSEGAVALIGTYQSAVSATVSSVAERNKVPFVIDASAADTLLSQGYRNTFRIPPGSKMMGIDGAKYLSEVSKAAGKPAAKVAILHEQGPFGTTVKDAFTTEAKRLGMQIVSSASYDAASVSDFTTQVTAVKASGADVLVVTGYYRDGVLIAQAVKTVKPGLAAVYGVANGAFDIPQFPAEAAGAGDGFFDANYHADAKSPQTKALAAKYKAAYGAEIRTVAVLSYEAIRVIADGLERAGKAEPAALRDAIAKTRLDSLMATNGPISFDQTGQNGNAIPILMQVQGQKVVQVHPVDKAEAKPVYPAEPGR